MQVKLTEGEAFIARGLNLLIRMSFAPSDQRASLEHFAKLKADIGPWLTDYADSIGAALQPIDPRNVIGHDD